MNVERGKDLIAGSVQRPVNCSAASSSPLADGPLQALSLTSTRPTMLFGTQSLTPEFKARYLLTLPSIRDRCSQVHDLAKEGKLEYFEYHPENEEKVADFCIQIIQVAGCWFVPIGRS